MKKNTLVLIGVLVVMVLIAVVQVVQFNKLSSKLSGLKVGGVAEPSVSSASTSSGSGSGNLPGVLANLPSQVGGC